jgi:hypothetical protein
MPAFAPSQTRGKLSWRHRDFPASLTGDWSSDEAFGEQIVDCVFSRYCHWQRSFANRYRINAVDLI